MARYLRGSLLAVEPNRRAAVIKKGNRIASRKGVNMKDQPTFFDFAAEVGLTKHIGGLEATEALIELCHIGEG